MTTWKELFDDFTSDNLLFQERVPITPRQFMRWAADARMKMQRRTKISDNFKTLTASGGSYNIGDDVLQIITGYDGDGQEMVLTSFLQNSMIREHDPLGYNEVPYNFSLKRDDVYIKTWGPEARTFYLNSDYNIKVHPDDGRDIVLHYTIDYHPFSSSSSQWAPWFVSDAAFETLFQTSTDAPELAQYNEGIVAYANMKYHKAIQSPMWTAYAQEYGEIIDTINQNKPVYYTNGTAPYNLGPIQ